MRCVLYGKTAKIESTEPQACSGCGRGTTNEGDLHGIGEFIEMGAGDMDSFTLMQVLRQCDPGLVA